MKNEGQNCEGLRMTDEAVKTLISILRVFIPTMDMATHTTQGFVLRMFSHAIIILISI